jgi:hypothetical protein
MLFELMNYEIHLPLAALRSTLLMFFIATLDCLLSANGTYVSINEDGKAKIRVIQNLNV